MAFTRISAGSMVFMKNLLGDLLQVEILRNNVHVTLIDIDSYHLETLPAVYATTSSWRRQIQQSSSVSIEVATLVDELIKAQKAGYHCSTKQISEGPKVSKRAAMGYSFLLLDLQDLQQ